MKIKSLVTKISQSGLKIFLLLLMVSPVLAQEQQPEEIENNSDIDQNTWPLNIEDNSDIDQNPSPLDVEDNAEIKKDSSPLKVEADHKDPMVLYDRNDLTIRSHIQLGINAVADTNLFWDFAEIVAPDSDFNSDTQWIEFYLKPGFSFEKKFPRDAIYGKISGVASYTLGTDPYDASDKGSITLEEGYLGYKTMLPDDRVNFDISLGPRELKLGTGMLIFNGGSSGFDRGALKFGPRKAWDLAAIAKIMASDITATAFYLSPNELPSSDNNNQLAGFDVRFDHPSNSYIGLSYINVLESESPYPQAAPGGIGAPTVIPGARKNLNSLDLYGKIQPFKGDLKNLFLTGEIAYQWNDRINMEAWGGRVQAGHTFSKAPWSPSILLYYQSFSGDNPKTSQLERFDPLFYDGSPSSWATGSKSSMVSINSNVQAFGLTLRFSPSPKDILSFRYAHVMADELRSPVQFGQATRLDASNEGKSAVSGVTNRNLSDDLFIEYSRIISKNIFLTVGFSLSIPGEGIRSAFPGDDPLWTGGFANIVFNF